MCRWRTRLKYENGTVEKAITNIKNMVEQMYKQSKGRVYRKKTWGNCTHRRQGQVYRKEEGHV